MAQQTYLLNNNEEEPLTLRWGFNWKNLQIDYQGQLVGEIATKKALLQGQEFQLPENRVMHVKLKGSFMPQLEVLVDNEPVSGSATHPEAVITQIFKLSLVLGGLNFILGLVAMFWPAEFLVRLGMGASSMFTGILIMALAYGIKKRSMAALIASISFWIVDYAASMYLASLGSGSTNPTSGLFLRIAIVYSLYRGISALKQLKQQQQSDFQAA